MRVMKTTNTRQSFSGVGLYDGAGSRDGTGLGGGGGYNGHVVPSRVE